MIAFLIDFLKIPNSFLSRPRTIFADFTGHLPCDILNSLACGVRPDLFAEHALKSHINLKASEEMIFKLMHGGRNYWQSCLT